MLIDAWKLQAPQPLKLTKCELAGETAGLIVTYDTQWRLAGRTPVEGTRRVKCHVGRPSGEIFSTDYSGDPSVVDWWLLAIVYPRRARLAPRLEGALRQVITRQTSPATLATALGGLIHGQRRHIARVECYNAKTDKLGVEPRTAPNNKPTGGCRAYCRRGHREHVNQATGRRARHRRARRDLRKLVAWERAGWPNLDGGA